MASSFAPEESSSSSADFNWRHDVFLSFRGEDTRSNFTSHLHMALHQKGVNVFIDHKLPMGEQISQSLLTSIEEALISVVVFSKNYASSSWCLDELVKIIECNKSKGRKVLPVFYKVHPSDIRNQTGRFGEALAKHQYKFRMIKIQTWRNALTAAANLTGCHLGTKMEADLIQDIVEKFLWILKQTYKPLYVAKFPVGIDSQLILLNSYSQYETKHLSDGAYMVGIYGIGGIGKTTLATALYNKIAYQFEGSCFLSNVRETSKHSSDLVQLQEKLLYEVLNEKLKVGNLDKGINIIKNRLRSKKVLIILDDVDKINQLEALVGEHDWFGSGSKIIVTTRNNHLLYSHEFDGKYAIQGLDHDNALELFSWHAFKKSHPSSDYVYLSERATTYCSGLPLALVVLGSFLCGRDGSQWETILEKFEKSLSQDIRDILQISYDGLEDEVKDVFLDISCLFVGEKVDYVKNVLNAYHLNDFGLIVLEDLSLVTIKNNRVQMHDLVRQMGHVIVNESSELGKRSRLWLEQDIFDVFRNNAASNLSSKGTDAIKAIKLDLSEPTRLDIDAKAFRNMKNLSLLVVRNATFSTKPKHLSDNLKWIEWHGLAHASVPSCFIKKSLVGLNLQHSFIKKLGKGFKVCERLERVDFSNSTLLEEISDFSGAPNLKELYLSNCTNLRTIDKSVFSLDQLIILKLDGCCNLRKLPRSTFLKCLEVLNLFGCKKLEKIPNLSASSNLSQLDLDECTNLRIVHESIGSLDKLSILSLRHCTNLERLPSYLKLKSLVRISLSHCCKLEKFPEITENMKSVRTLDLDFTIIKELPSSIGYLTGLLELNINCCPNLISLPSSIYVLSSLRKLQIRQCFRFETFPKTSWSLEYLHSLVPEEILCSQLTLLDLRHCNISNLDILQISCYVLPFLQELLLSENKFSSIPSCLHKLRSLWNLQLRNCKFLREIPNLPQSIRNLDACGCKSLTAIPNNIVDIISNKQDIRSDGIGREFLFTYSEIPEGFYQTATNLIRANFRHYSDMKRTLAICVVFKVNGDSHENGAFISFNICIYNRLRYSFARKFLPSKSQYTWLVTTSLEELEDWNEISVWFNVVNDAIVTLRSCGVHVTEELHEMQRDVKWPVVNYTDFYRPEKFPNLDNEANSVRGFVQEISLRLNCKAMLSVENYDPDRIGSKTQPIIFPLHETYDDFTSITGLKKALNDLTDFLIMRGRSHFGSSFSHLKYEKDHEVPIRDDISSIKYLIILERSRFDRRLWFKFGSGFGDSYISFECVESVDISRCYYLEEMREKGEEEEKKRKRKRKRQRKRRDISDFEV